MALSKSALILGSTGLIGSSLLELLLQDATYSKVRILVRKQTSQNHPRLEQVVVNYDQLANHAALFAVDEVYCCLGTTIKKAGSQEAFYKVDATYPYEAAKLARQNGARQFLLVTAMGADKSSGIFYNRVKGEVEEKIAALGIPSFHIFRPSLLLGERSETRTGEAIAQKVMPLFSFLLVGRLKKYKPVEGSKVARAMLQVAKQNLPGKHIFESDQIQEMGR